MEFRILGPLEVADGERSISLEAPKQRALLGLLLLHPNEVVSSERVIDELWGERPPATAGKLVQTYVSQLRKTLGPGVITTQPPGYLLPPEHVIDATHFRGLASQARGRAANREPTEADVLYRRALALWRGPPLVDVAFQSFARNEVESLEEERLDALSARIDCELALGQHEYLVSELEALVRRYPLRERFRAQFMLALYRSGRQAEALDTFRSGHRILADELGLDPSRELQTLERAILSHDPALDAPPTKPVSADHGSEPPPPHRMRVLHPPWRSRVRLVGALCVVGVGVALAFAFDQGHPASLRLPASSLGFLDAGSGRITREFPVGRAPGSIAVTNNSIWVANFDSQTVTRITRAPGHPEAIPVGGHPSGIAASNGSIWVWTLEGLLVRIDPRYDRATTPVRLAPAGGTPRAPGRITAGGGFLWITAPPTTVLRVAPDNLKRRTKIVPPTWGAGGPIVEGRGTAWIAGSSYTGYVFPLQSHADTAGTGIAVGGPVRDLALQDDTLWVVSGGSAGLLPHQDLRAVDLHGQIVRTTVPVGSDPVAVVEAAGSIWVADPGDRTIWRVDPSGGKPDQIKVGARPIALAADRSGIWVTTG